MPTLTKLYTLEEASQHNTSEDCWITIDGKVYDVSSYLDEHPGGDDVILGATGNFSISIHNTIKSLPTQFPDTANRLSMELYLSGFTLFLSKGKDATDEFEDAGHSKTARELLETFCIGELEETTTPIPELEIVSKKQQLNNLPQKFFNLSKQYWFAPITVVGLSVGLGYLYLRKKQAI
ncbi:Cytochrome b5 isoform A, variant 2 [Salvia divinorum]|uniref:Cytochrome b5 isoform A, variant 2 n=1 Tax=Salvia divinorum TaxID=28513 RepID=A0ABD1HN34_SALDI